MKTVRRYRKCLPLAALIFLSMFSLPNSLTAALPQGKARFSVVFGNLDTSLSVWTRLGRWTFDDAAGTVAGTFWQWDTVAEKGKTALNSHTCTFDGVTKTCTQYTPTGFIYPAQQYFELTATYTYNPSTGALSIAWSNGRTENWYVSVPETGLASVDFVSATGYGAGYGITHGKGFGSNASWNTFKTMSQVPLGSSTKHFRGDRISCSSPLGATPFIVDPTTPGAWEAEVLDFSAMTLSSNGLALHFKSAITPDGCLASCYSPPTGHNGVVYHFAGTNTGRAMIFNTYCACLANPDQFPCYPGTIHPFAVDQIINDAGAMRGMVAVHQQDQPGSAGFSYSLHTWLIDL